MAIELNKTYDPKSVEERWARIWLEKRYFHADPLSSKPSFSMVIPPPNITGSLHLGHALNNTLQDILARWRRMSGFNTLWVPGMDHAGIATQNVVERQLAENGIDRHQLGREEFIKRVSKWKETSGGTILKQLQHLGASCDWSRERFTMDQGLSRAVREVFVRLYDEGLIYRAERLINWCPRCQTALSDVEVEHEEVQGKMFHIKYPLAENPVNFLTVATTRPETLLGDTGAAVHPDDPRFNGLIGKKVQLPLTDRTIPIVGDAVLVDREFGTGAVKITPGHDFNDEQAGKRHRLPKISLIDRAGTMSAVVLQEAGVEPDLIQALGGKSMSESRKLVVQRLEERGLLIKIEEHRHSLGKCYRCKTIVEPFDSPQWFVKVNDPQNSLARPAIDAVRRKKIRLIPESWEPNYFGWMENIQDWCISRQIWWGHQIPAWYCKRCDEKNIFGIRDSDEVVIAIQSTPIVGKPACPRCGSKELIQDPDVLDTWFSSALWPFSTLGWPTELEPDEAKRKDAEILLKKFYPTATLVSAFDILFFWIARMIMMGLHFMKEVPFRDVYIHALVRDAEGQKMSKSKGNVIDPLEVMDRYGTDALRFTLAAMASPGRDIKLAEERIEGYRNFANKLWNAARFSLMNLPAGFTPGEALHDSNDLSLANRWILTRLHRTIDATNRSLEQYRFDEAASSLYQFVWHEFCDWYLELIKVDLQEGDEARRKDALNVLVATFESILRLLHPFMPYITEELWVHFPHQGESLSISSYPKVGADAPDLAVEGIVQKIVIETVVGIRNLRGEMSIPPSEELTVLINPSSNDAKNLFDRHLRYVERLARTSVKEVRTGMPPPKSAARILTSFAEIYVPLDEARVRKEIERLQKILLKVDKEIEPLEKKSNDPNFTAKAPKEVVAKLERQRAEKHEEKLKLNADLQRFKEMIS